MTTDNQQAAREWLKTDKACVWLFSAIFIVMVIFDQPFGSAWFGFCAGSVFERVRHD